MYFGGNLLNNMDQVKGVNKVTEQGNNLCSVVNMEELVSRIKNSMETDQDDDFFHVTCHIDQNLKAKIEKGEFVELEKLFPRNRTQVLTDERRLQFFYQNGETFFAPAEKDGKINSVHKWEQALRVYAAVYCATNPSRSAEIWQYVLTINKAGASYSWENMYFYDSTLRHLMENKPNRSWAKMYTQMWTLAMCDPLVKNYQNNYASFQGHGSNSSQQRRNKFNSSNSGSNGVSSAQKPKYCGKFTKNRTHKANGTYVHRCSYYDGADHARVSCNKRNSKETKETK